MLPIEVNVNDAAASAGISSLLESMGDKTAMHEEMAQGVEAEVSDHLLGLNTRSPNTSFHGHAARSSAVEADFRVRGAVASVPMG